VTVLIVCVYCERPKMVRNAIESVRDQTDGNWHLAFIDDGSRVPGEPVVRDILGDDPRVTFYRCDDDAAQKDRQKGSRHGEYMNWAIRGCPGDVVVVLCDDDALHPECVANVRAWFTENDSPWGYGHVHEFNPYGEKPGQVVRGSQLNQHTGSVDPVCRLDSTQVCYRPGPIRSGEAGYPSLGTGALDASIYTQLLDKYGQVPYMGFVTQYKGVYPGQMGKRDSLHHPQDLP